MKKIHWFPFFILIIITLLLVFLYYNHDQLTGYSNIISAIIGALSGSLGAYTISLINNKSLKRTAERRIKLLLQYNYKRFRVMEKGTTILYGKLMYDENWPDYLMLLDNKLTENDMKTVIEWFECIYFFEKMLKDHLQKDNKESLVAYETAMSQAKKQLSEIDKIINNKLK
ncbi:hypothetical protein [Bacillus haynesii]|uniref:hypothetical protein n=1 Tax=Bacillus haynesii TaxID=1925021 RepID=UPI002282C36C|nr:hypothetical protein [Bacillus haynesii]MCY8615296.1 hypothetical protein [Bacillus haynesii]MCY9434662.1 hypothetical protein [Bacillus haynesii]